MRELKRGDDSITIDDLGMLQDIWLLTGDRERDPRALSFTLYQISPADLLGRRAIDKEPLLGQPAMFAVTRHNRIDLYPAADRDYVIQGRYFPPMKEL